MKEYFIYACINANKSRIRTAEEIEKVRQSKIGVPRPNWVRNKVSQTRIEKYGTRVIAVKDCAVYEFNSMQEASSVIGRDRASIKRASKSPNFKCNGFTIYI